MFRFGQIPVKSFRLVKRYKNEKTKIKKGIYANVCSSLETERRENPGPCMFTCILFLFTRAVRFSSLLFPSLCFFTAPLFSTVKFINTCELNLRENVILDVCTTFIKCQRLYTIEFQTRLSCKD